MDMQKNVYHGGGAAVIGLRGRCGKKVDECILIKLTRAHANFGSK